MVSDVLSKSRARAWVEAHASCCVLMAGAAIGLCCFAYYYSSGLTLAHYDAKAHLLVARRIVDSAEPGYQQMGAHWLPLIHLLYLPFVVFEAQYRSGLFPSLISVCAFALSGWLVHRISLHLTGSRLAALYAAAVLLANPNLQFLQTAPLTEPVYMILMLLALDSLLRWRDRGAGGIPWFPAAWASLAALCRYEGWFFLGGAIALLLYDAVTGRTRSVQAFKAVATYLGCFLAPALVHFGYIYWKLGDSFLHRVVRGTPAPYETYGHAVRSVVYHFGEIIQAAAILPAAVAVAGILYCACNRERLRRCLPYFLLWLPSAVNIAALYWGLIYRVRYSVLLLPAIAVFGSIVAGREVLSRRLVITGSALVFMLPWISWLFPRTWEYHLLYPGPGILLLPAAALVLMLLSTAVQRYRMTLLALIVVAMQVPVLDGEWHAAAKEALEHSHLDSEQKQLLGFLGNHFDGTRVLIDVGRLAPLMYDSGLPIRAFIYHEGNGKEWGKAVADPRRVAGWILSEQGDEIWALLQVDPDWADGYSLAVRTKSYVLLRLNREERNMLPASGKPE